MRRFFIIFIALWGITACANDFPSGIYEYSYTWTGDIEKGENPFEFTKICTLSISSSYYGDSCDDIEDYNKTEIAQYIDENKKRVIWKEKDGIHVSNEYDNIFELGNQYLRCRIHIKPINEVQIGVNTTCIDFTKEPLPKFPSDIKALEYYTYTKAD